MQVFEAIKWRRSVRKFSPRKIEKEKILQILEAARLAPSSSNRQAWHFVVIDDESLIKAIPQQEIGGSRVTAFIKDAPLVITGCYTKKLSHTIAQLFGHENHLVDISIALTHIVLAATELGIGSCYIGWFSEKNLKKMLGIPGNFNIACLIALGYPADVSTPEGIGGIASRPRKKLNEIVSYNKFGERFL